MSFKRSLKFYLSIMVAIIGMLCLNKTYATEYARVVLVGDLGSGKTSLWNSFFGKPYNPKEMASDIMTREDYTAQVNGKTVQFNIWDTAGAAKYYDQVVAFTQGANFVFIVQDLSEPYSSARERYLGKLCKDIHAKMKKDGQIFLVGTKYDKRFDDIINAGRQMDLVNSVARAVPAPCVFTEAPNGKDVKINRLLELLAQKSQSMSLYSSDPDPANFKRFTVPKSGWWFCTLL